MNEAREAKDGKKPGLDNKTGFLVFQYTPY